MTKLFLRTPAVRFFGFSWSAYWATRTPSNLIVTWVEDYASMSFTDNSGGLLQHQIWESKNGGDYSLITTLAAGIVAYHNFTWQNANMNFKVCAIKAGHLSPFTSVVNVVTPLVFKNNQTPKVQTLIKTLNIDGGKTVNINWGDASNVDKTGNNSNITKDYASTGSYFITMSGDLNYINFFEFYNQAILTGTLISRWCLPSVLTFGHFYNNGMIGDITQIAIPSGCAGAHFGVNAITSDITNMDSHYNNVFWDIHISSTISGGITGNIGGWILPLRNAHIQIYGDVTGNLTDWNPWQAVTYSGVILDLQSTNVVGLTGDLSGWVIPDLTATLQANTGCHFTKLPRGNFSKVSLYQFQNNACDRDEIDSILAYIDNYFTGGVVPTCNCNYILGTASGGGTMAGPSMTGFPHIASIKAKYIAAGYVATITTNPIELPSFVETDGKTKAVYDIFKSSTLTFDAESPPRVSAWRDKLGSGNDITNGGATTTQPWYFALTCVSFAANTHYLQGAFNLSHPIFVYAVLKQTNWFNNRRLFDGGDSTSDYVIQNGTSPGIKGGGASLSGEEGHATLNVTVILRVLFNGANSKLIVNDNTPITWDCGAYDLNNFILGNRYLKDIAAYVNYLEVIIRNASDSAPDEAEIYTYLKTKYTVAD